MSDFSNSDFLYDKEKMRDFFTVSKEEFLQSYSYLTEEEYDNTADKIYGSKEPKNITLKQLCSQTEISGKVIVRLSRELYGRRTDITETFDLFEDSLMDYYGNYLVKHIFPIMRDGNACTVIELV